MFDRAELLNYHLSICGECRSVEFNLITTLADFAAHICAAPAKKKAKLDDTPSHAVPDECPKATRFSSTEALGASLAITRKQSKKA